MTDHFGARGARGFGRAGWYVGVGSGNGGGIDFSGSGCFVNCNHELHELGG